MPLKRNGTLLKASEGCAPLHRFVGAVMRHKLLSVVYAMVAFLLIQLCALICIGSVEAVSGARQSHDRDCAEAWEYFFYSY